MPCKPVVLMVCQNSCLSPWFNAVNPHGNLSARELVSAYYTGEETKATRLDPFPKVPRLVIGE